MLKDDRSKIDRLKIKQVQQSLQVAGYDPGPADGVLGLKTRSALKKSQRDNNLSVTGSINQETLEAIAMLESL